MLSLKPKFFNLEFNQTSLIQTTAHHMSQMNQKRERPDTPCVAVCSTTFDDVCRGCGRTVAEVADWVFMSNEQKEVVWTRILSQGYPRRNR